MLSEFSRADFDASEYASAALAKGAASEATRSLTDGVGKLDGELRREVEVRQGELMENIKHLTEVEDVLGAAKLRVDALQSSAR